MQGSYKGVWVCLLVISLISSLVTCGMATKKAKLLGPPRGFVQASGTIFTIDGKPWFCAGTNQFGVALIDRLSDNEVKELFRIHRERGANVIRVFAHSDGYGFPREMQVAEPIQPELGQYNEKALRRLDLVLAEARKNKIKLILPFTNYEPFLGGIQWYAEQVHGRGADKELFFTDSTIRNYYKKYVSMLLKRRNTITGTKYRDDPTVMAWELMNEPHTRQVTPTINLAPEQFFLTNLPDFVYLPSKALLSHS
jgi:mannan endo-1,4-beta-mannosidase